MEEIWSTHGLPEGYAVSNLGRVRGRMKVLKPSVSSRGYLSVSIYSSVGKAKRFRVNRLVATAFKDNPNDLPCVNHKNGIKTDNSASNLEWVTYSDNMQHAYDTKLKLPTNGRKVEISNIGTGVKTVVDSAWAAARFVNGQQPNVYACCVKNRCTHKGHSFRFV